MHENEITNDWPGKKTFEWILFDADETLFDFNSFQGLQNLFSNLGTSFSNEDFAIYQNINRQLWTEFQNNKISAEQLGAKRFELWTENTGKKAHELNTMFLNHMSEISNPLQGAMDLLTFLKGKVKMGIITNGFTLVQEKRLKRLGLLEHFEIVIVSEQVGFAKPHAGIFIHALNAMGNPAPQKVLMIGDTLESDILGAAKMGFATCWFNAHQKIAPDHIQPHFQFSSLEAINEWALNGCSGRSV